MFLPINERIYPQFAATIGVILIFVSALYFVTNDSIKHYDWPWVVGERVEGKTSKRRAYTPMSVRYKDIDNNVHVVEVDYMPRDYRTYYPPDFGDEVALRYNPDNPQEAVISFRYPYRQFLLTGLVLAFLMGWYYFIQGVRYGGR